jgi:hypothetical protein
MVRKITTDVPLTVSDLRALARESTASLPEGASLSSFETALLRVGLTASVTLLDRSAAAAAIDTAFAAGASSQQVQEIVSLVSGLGVHSLIMTAPMIIAAAARAGESAGGPLTVAQQDLWDRHVGEDPFWESFEREMPGFLEAMLRLSPDQFTAFFDYCAVPWKSGTVRACIKELVAMAVDATPAHRFLPGFKLHLANAIALGVGRVAIDEALDLAEATSPHVGTRQALTLRQASVPPSMT